MVDKTQLEADKPFVSPYLRLKPRSFEEARRETKGDPENAPTSDRQADGADSLS